MAATSKVEREETGSGIDHGLLTGLGDDDHTQYALLAGRAGTTNDLLLSTSGATGGTLTGSSVAGGALNLASTSHATEGTIRLLDTIELVTSDFSSSSPVFLMRGLPTNTITLSAGASLQGLSIEQAVSLSGTMASTGLLMFNFKSVFTPTAAFNLQAAEIYKANPTINGIGGTALGTVANPYTSFLAQPNLANISAVPSQGTATITNVYGFYVSSAARVGTGWTVTNYQGLRLDPPLGTGTITTLVGCEIRDLAGRGGTNIALRQVGTSDSNRLAGPTIIGTTGAPNTTKGLDLSGDFATRKTDISITATPTNNLSIGQTSLIRVTTTTGAAFSITGMTPGYDGKRVVMINASSQNMTLVNESALSTAANRFTTQTGADVVLDTNGGAIEFVYDSTSSRWRSIGTVL
jgi:hypothetical protein